MGDTGSLFLGGLIAGLALYMEVPLVLIMIGIVPIIETITVIIQVVYYKKTGKTFFKMAPIHHHFELSGWSEPLIVFSFALVTAIGCGLGLFSVYI